MQDRDGSLAALPRSLFPEQDCAARAFVLIRHAPPAQQDADWQHNRSAGRAEFNAVQAETIVAPRIRATQMANACRDIHLDSIWIPLQLQRDGTRGGGAA